MRKHLRKNILSLYFTIYQTLSYIYQTLKNRESTNMLLYVYDIKRIVGCSCYIIDRRVEQRGNRAQELEKRAGVEEGARRPDLFMNAEIPRGSLGVPKHQRDCVPSRRYSITGLSECPHPCSTLLNCRTLSYAVLDPDSPIHATGHRHAN